jgi:hypothetical protein
MKTPIDPRTLSPRQQAALFDAVRRDAQALRNAAIADAFTALWRAAARATSPVWPRATLEH